MNVETGNEGAQFHFWEYLFRYSVSAVYVALRVQKWKWQKYG